MERSAIIVGGSIAGLVCGIMLKHHGYDVTILERDVSPSRQGYDAGIKIGPAMEAFLKKHDRVNREMIVTCTPGYMINVNGEPKAQRGQTMYMCSWGLLVSVLRANFDGCASAVVPVVPEAQDTDGKATFRLGAQVVGVEQHDGMVQVRFLDANSGTIETLAASIGIVADGSNSSMRNILLPGVKREYRGYLCWRGTVREEEIEAKWNKLYSEKATFHLGFHSYLLNYTIPTDDGELEKGKRLHNWVWYSKLPENSPKLLDLFTDINGDVHHGTVPRGLVRPELWDEQKSLALETLPEGLAAIVKGTRAPFITKVYDVTSDQAVFLDGKIFMVGDAQVTLRPNVGMGATHAANDCNELEKVIEGSVTAHQWERTVLRWGAAQQRFAMVISAYGLDTMLSVVWNGLCWLMLLLGQRVGIL